MESTANKSENDKDSGSKSSAATKDQNSKQDTKETGKDHFLKSIVGEIKKLHRGLDTSFKNMAKDNKRMFEKQDQLLENHDLMIAQQNQFFSNLMKTMENRFGKGTEREKEQAEKVGKEPEKENDNYVLFRNAYQNLAQRNTSRENEVKIEVQVTNNYKDTLAKLDRIRNITANN